MNLLLKKKSEDGAIKLIVVNGQFWQLIFVLFVSQNILFMLSKLWVLAEAT